MTDPSHVDPSHHPKPTHDNEQGPKLDNGEIVVDLCMKQDKSFSFCRS